MQTTIWIVTTITLAVLAVGALIVARRHRRTLLPASPGTISVTEPTLDTLESPRHAAEASAARSPVGHADGGAHRRSA